MHSFFRLKEFAFYLINARGIGNIHSPFVYEFMKEVLYDNRNYYAYYEIENLRNKLLLLNKSYTITDFGAVGKPEQRQTRTTLQLIKKSAKPAAQAQLLYRLALYYQGEQILEIGTSLGFSAMYLAAAGKSSRVITLEGSTALANAARKNFDLLKLRNIEVLEGAFKTTLPDALSKMGKTDLVFFDGDHRKEPTLNYFNMALPYRTESSIFIFDDIYWSPGMKAAWKEIKNHPEVTLTIDLYFLGIVFFNRKLSKQDFVLRF